jgi:cytochrome c oxidase subunit III
MTSVTTAAGSDAHSEPARLPEAPVGHTTGWWAMVLFICTESATFAAALASYFYLRFIGSGPWPPVGDSRPSLLVPSVGTAILVVGCVPMGIAVRAARRPGRLLMWVSLVVTLLTGVAFVILQLVDYRGEWPDSTLSKDAYGSLFYSITGLHGLHVAVGVLMVAVLVASASRRRIGAGQAGPVRIVAMYWYFLAVIALAVYATVYISPYL